LEFFQISPNVIVLLGLTQQMALERLRESVRNRNHTMLKQSIVDDCQSYHTMLKQSIVDCQSVEKLQKNKELRNARKTLQVIEARRGQHSR